MLLSLFKKNDPIVLVFIPILATLLLWNTYYSHGLEELGHFSPFFSEIEWLLIGTSPASFYIVLVMAVIYSTYLIRLNSLNILYQTRTYLEGIIFIMLLFGTGSIKALTPALIGSIFLLFSINALFRIEKVRDLGSVFNSSFFLSIGSLFFFDLIFYLPVLWLSLAIIKSASFREWIVSIIGFIVPVFIIGIVYYLSDDLDYVYKSMKNNFEFKYKLPELKIGEMIYFGFTLLLLTFALVKSAYGIQAKKIKVRKMFFVFNLFAIVAITLLFVTGFDLNHWITAVCIITVIFTRYFVQMKSKFWAETLFFLFFLAVIAQFIPFVNN